MTIDKLASSQNCHLFKHSVTTDDGYINALFRVQSKKKSVNSNSPVILVQHGVLSSGEWGMSQKEKSYVY
jgi:hypothetical protein